MRTTTPAESQSACCRYAICRTTNLSLTIPSQRPTLPDTGIVWIPGHSSLPGNDVPHSTDRPLTCRSFLEGMNHLHPQTPLPSNLYLESTPIRPPPTISPTCCTHYRTRPFPSRMHGCGAAYTKPRYINTLYI